MVQVNVSTNERRLANLQMLVENKLTRQSNLIKLGKGNDHVFVTESFGNRMTYMRLVGPRRRQSLLLPQRKLLNDGLDMTNMSWLTEFSSENNQIKG